MANLYCLTRTQHGMILITVLLILLVLTLLTMSALRTSLLEIKMSHNYATKILAFQKAAKILAAKEKLLVSSKTPPASVKKLFIAPSGAVFYQVTADASYGHAHALLQSTYEVIGTTGRRKSWRMVA